MCQTSTLFAQNPEYVETRNDFSSVLGLNIRCLDYDFEDFLVLLEALTPKPDIMAITETWTTENDPLEEFQIDGYQPIVSNPREEFKRRPGGVAFYIKEGIEYEPIETSINIECQLIKVKYDHDLVKNFCGIYRPFG